MRGRRGGVARCAGAALLSCAVLAGGVAAPSARGDLPPAGAAALALDVEAAIGQALRTAFGIRRLRHGLATSQSSLLSAENRYDFKLRTTFTVDTDLRRHLAVELVPGVPVRRDVFEGAELLSLTLSRELPTGGVVDVHSDLRRSSARYAEVDPFHSATWGVAFTQPLVQGRGRRVATSAQVGAEIGYLDRARQLVEAEMALVVDVTRAFYQVVRAESLIRINETAVARAEERLRTASLRLQEGLITPIDVSRSERELRARQDSVIAARESWEDARDGLLFLLGLPLDTPFELEVDVAFAPTRMDVEDALAEALGRRIDLANQEDALELAELGADVARSNARPRVDLTVGADFTSVGGDELEEIWDFDPQDDWRVGLVFTHLFGERSDDEALVQARIAVASERLRLEELRRRITREVRNAVRNVQSLERRVVVLDEGVVLAEESLKLATLQFDEGLISTVDLLADQDQLVQAETDATNALYDHAIARANLDLVLGRYWADEPVADSELLRPEPRWPADLVPGPSRSQRPGWLPPRPAPAPSAGRPAPGSGTPPEDAR
jgi:outer membrane protein TolC